jgi:hypothetical protein
MNRQPICRTLVIPLLLLTSAQLGIAAQAQSRYSLRHRVAVGDRHVWDSISTASLKLTARTGDEEAPPIESTTRFRQTVQEEVLTTRGSTVMKLRQRFLVARDIGTGPEGNPSIETSSLQGKTFTMGRQGEKVVISPAGAKISPADRKQLSQALEQAYLSLLPNREAPMGEEWTIAKLPTARYGEVRLQLPGPEWKVIRHDPEARRLELGRPQEGGMRGVSIWPVEVAPAERYRSPKEHAAAYFEFERGLERPDGPWTGFKEEERQIGGQRYPTMSFQFHPNVATEHVMDGLFLAYFPKEFPRLHRFYVLMWSDLHLKRARPHGIEELDAMVASLQVP